VGRPDRSGGAAIRKMGSKRRKVGYFSDVANGNRSSSPRGGTLAYWGLAMSGEDVLLRCSECGQEFPFTATEQQFFRERGYTPPKRCKPCRQAKQAAGSFGQQDSRPAGYTSGAGHETTVVCASCGQTTTVPFEPRGDRPVYCKNCYKPKQGGRGRGGSSGGGNRGQDRRRY
jgi:CxxC-x17-CxxC domain-containing protein